MLLRVLSSTSSSSSNSSQPQDEKEGDESPPSLNSILMTSDEDREIETQKEKVRFFLKFMLFYGSFM